MSYKLTDYEEFKGRHTIKIPDLPKKCKLCGEKTTIRLALMPFGIPSKFSLVIICLKDSCRWMETLIKLEEGQ